MAHRNGHPVGGTGGTEGSRKKRKARMRKSASLLGIRAVCAVLGFCLLGAGCRGKESGGKTMATWIKTAMEFQRGEVTLLYPEGLAGGLEEYAAVVNAADLSTVSADPAAANMRGLIRPGDVLVFTQDALYWLDMTCDRLRTTNGGGGLLRGCWPLKAGEGGLLALPFP